MSDAPRKKICHVMHDGSGQGGGATFALSCFPAYTADYDVLVITGRDGDLAARLEQKGIRTKTLDMERPWRALLEWPQIWSILYEEKPDAVIVHGQWGGFFGATAAWAAGCKTILYYTHFPSFYADWDLPRVIRNRIAESITCRCATRIVCLSAAGRYQYLLRRLAPEDKLALIPNGIDPAHLTQRMEPSALRRRFHPPLADEAPVVVSVSRLAFQKRIDWLLRAWAIVESRHEEAHLAIVGAGPEEKTLRELAQNLGLKRCGFLGARPAGYRYYQAADVGVICSMFEGHPLALIEAMFLGCPAVGTIVDGIGETIVDQKTGLLVPPADPPALAGAILALLNDPPRAREMGEAARARAHALYHADIVLKEQLQLLKDELASAGAADR